MSGIMRKVRVMITMILMMRQDVVSSTDVPSPNPTIHHHHHHLSSRHPPPQPSIPARSSRTPLSSSAAQSIFVPRSLWMDPIDYTIPPALPLSSLPLPQALSMSSQRDQQQQVMMSASNSLLQQHMQQQQQQQQQQQGPDPQYGNNNSSFPPHDQAQLEKTLFELLNSNSNNNYTMPLNSEKYFWQTYVNDPRNIEVYQYHPIPTSAADVVTSESSVILESESEAPADAIKNDPLSSLPSLLYPTEHMKVVSLCDKTLALLDYGNPSNTALLKCELFDLEKNPEIAYTEAKKTGIPIQSVTFKEMRDIINACRVLSEADFTPTVTTSVVVNGMHAGNNPVSGQQQQQQQQQPSSNPHPIIISSSIHSVSNGEKYNQSSKAGTKASPSSSSQSVLPSSQSASIASLNPGSTKGSVPALPPSSLSAAQQQQQQQQQSSQSPGQSSGSATSSSSQTSEKGSLWTSWRALLPGTKWCGMGDSARNYHDLGKRRDVDVCCRAHDHCPIRLKALRMGYGLINLSLYTKSHCDCDEDFKRCLKQANSKSAEMLANFYFNIMKVQCIRAPDSQLVCREFRKNKTTGADECIRYEDDKGTHSKMVYSQPEAVTFS